MPDTCLIRFSRLGARFCIKLCLCFWKEPEDKRVPAKEYIEKKLAELEAGEFRAETLGEVLTPHWGAKGHLSIKKRNQLRGSAHRTGAATTTANGDAQCLSHDKIEAYRPGGAGRYHGGPV